MNNNNLSILRNNKHTLSCNEAPHKISILGSL